MWVFQDKILFKLDFENGSFLSDKCIRLCCRRIKLPPSCVCRAAAKNVDKHLNSINPSKNIGWEQDHSFIAQRTKSNSEQRQGLGLKSQIPEENIADVGVRNVSRTLSISENSDIRRKHHSRMYHRKRRWWHRGFSSRPLQWHEWNINQLYPGIKPILVFINSRSGPQIGNMIRLRLMRILHPLQVVSLPRDSPEHALRTFVQVPGLRILCIGGDGTVGW